MKYGATAKPGESRLFLFFILKFKWKQFLASILPTVNKYAEIVKQCTVNGKNHSTRRINWRFQSKFERWTILTDLEKLRRVQNLHEWKIGTQIRYTFSWSAYFAANDLELCKKNLYSLSAQNRSCVHSLYELVFICCETECLRRNEYKSQSAAKIYYSPKCVCSLSLQWSQFCCRYNSLLRIFNYFILSAPNWQFVSFFSFF